MLRRFPAGRAATAALLAAVLLGVATQILAFREIRDLSRAIDVARYARDVLAATSALLEAATDAETWERGYLLTGDEAYLEPYRAAAERLPRSVERLAQLTADDPEEAERVAELRSLAGTLLAALDHAIDVHQREGQDAAAAAVRTNIAKGFTDRIRVRIDEIRSKQSRILRDRMARRELQSRRTRLVVLAAGITAVTLLLGASVLLHRSARRRQEAEEHLHDERQRLEITLRSIGDAVIATDRSGSVVLVNPAAEALTGWSDAAARGAELDRVFAVVDEKTGEPLESPVQAVLRADAATGLGGHILLRSRDGAERPIEHNAAPIRAADGSVVGVVLVFRDVSEQRRQREADEEIARLSMQREAAELASRTKDFFLAAVSHELRTPITAILNWVEIAKLDEGARARAIETIERSARLQSDLIDDLLDVARMVSGKFRIELAPVDVAAVVRETAETAAPDAGARRLRFEVDVPAEPVVVMGDARRLHQLVSNLLSNAIKFTPEGGTVRVRLGATPHRVTVRVEDTGPGIAPDLLERVFEPFEQGRHQESGGPGGLGIGLALVRYIAELHEGSVRAESDGPGRGSVFVVTLPAASGRAVAAAPASIARDALAERSVLVIDDDADARESLAAYLERRGARVRTAATADDAFRAIEADAPSVVLTDLVLRERDGFAVLGHVRAADKEHGRHTIVVAVTGSSARDRDQMLAAGFDDHAPKPIDLPGLVGRLALLIARTEEEARG